MDIDNMLDEIVAMANGSINMQDYFGDFMKAIQETIQKKYVDKMSTVFSHYKDETQRNENREAKLLQAFKPFITEEYHDHVDQMAEALYTIQALQKLMSDVQFKSQSLQEIQAASKKEEQPIRIHEDGVYEVDEKCQLNKNSRQKQNNGMNLNALLLLLMSML